MFRNKSCNRLHDYNKFIILKQDLNRPYYKVKAIT
jgi:hypothetical protein